MPEHADSTSSRAFPRLVRPMGASGNADQSKPRFDIEHEALRVMFPAVLLNILSSLCFIRRETIKSPWKRKFDTEGIGAKC